MGFSDVSWPLGLMVSLLLIWRRLTYTDIRRHRPLPMYGSGYIFGKGFFEAWIIFSIIWVWGTMFVAGFFPIVDGWKQLRAVYRGLRASRHSKGDSSGLDTPQDA